MQHWLPYDEARLYAAAGRHARRHLALAARRHAQPGRPRAGSAAGTRATLAAQLVAPWQGTAARSAAAGRCSRRARCARSPRATSRSTSSSTRCTRTRSPTTRRRSSASRAASSSSALRRSELSPLQICRLNGLLARARPARGRARRCAHVAAARRRRARRCPPRRRARLLARQLRQVPRWLQQTRYNGPPPMKLPRESTATASNYSNNAVLSARRVARRVRGLRGAPGRRQVARRDRRARPPAQQARCRGSSARAIRRRAARAALVLQPRDLGRRALRRLRVRRGQPQLRQALRADGASTCATTRSGRTYTGSPAAAVGRSPALGLQPDDLRRRQARRVRVLARPAAASSTCS